MALFLLILVTPTLKFHFPQTFPFPQAPKAQKKFKKNNSSNFWEQVGFVLQMFLHPLDGESSRKRQNLEPKKLPGDPRAALGTP